MNKRAYDFHDEVCRADSIRELEALKDFQISTASDARMKLAAKLWARIGRILNQIGQRPTMSAVDEALEVLEMFRNISDSPIAIDTQINEIERCLLDVKTKITP